MMPTERDLSLSTTFYSVFKRDVLLAFRRKNDLFNPLIFFLMVATLFPLGVNPEPVFLSEVASGVVWVAALLATLLSLDGLFRSDYEDGTLEQVILSPQPLMVVCLAKVLAHWATTGLPLTLVSPLLGVMLFLPSSATPALILSLLVGTLTLSLIGAIGAGLTVGLKRGGVLISLLVMPLYIPVLIFGTGVVNAAALGVPYVGFLSILGAFLCGAFVLAPFAIAAAVKISVSQ